MSIWRFPSSHPTLLSITSLRCHLSPLRLCNIILCFKTTHVNILQYTSTRTSTEICGAVCVMVIFYFALVLVFNRAPINRTDSTPPEIRIQK